jgi:chromosome segregation ATPase
MMKEEFDKLVGFETRYEEYKDIEKDYMGTDIDKVKFAADWKKNDGIARLSRMRTREIEELKSQIAQMERNRETALKAKDTEKEKLIAQVSAQSEEIASLTERLSGVDAKVVDQAAIIDRLQHDFDETVDALRVLDRIVFHRTA